MCYVRRARQPSSCWVGSAGNCVISGLPGDARSKCYLTSCASISCCCSCMHFLLAAHPVCSIQVLEYVKCAQIVSITVLKWNRGVLYGDNMGVISGHQWGNPARSVINHTLTEPDITYITMFVLWHHMPMMYATNNRPYSCQSTYISLFWLRPSVVPSSFTSTQTAMPFALLHRHV
jgi:hypothetical protein